MAGRVSRTGFVRMGGGGDSSHRRFARTESSRARARERETGAGAEQMSGARRIPLPAGAVSERDANKVEKVLTQKTSDVEVSQGENTRL